VTVPYEKNAAIIVLPAVSGARLQDAGLKSWLSRSSLQSSSQPKELLESVLAALNLPYPDEGLAALRMWGQTGDRPTVWIAAADPVYLEPRLDHLCLHALDKDALPVSDHRLVFDHLQQTLADEQKFGFARIGNCGYLRSSVPMATAHSPAYVVDQCLPNEFMPSGEASGSYRNLLSEVEMSLHEHEVNVRRDAEGLPPINSLWLWGGGFAPEQHTEPHPPLFADDPLLKGYWMSKTGVVQPWPDSIAACLEASVAGFVAVPGFAANDIESVQRCLQELRTALDSTRLSRLILLFQDGLVANVLRQHAWRFWRPLAPFFA